MERGSPGRPELPPPAQGEGPAGALGEHLGTITPTLPPVPPSESLAGPRALVEMLVLLEAPPVLAQPSCHPGSAAISA